MTKPEPKAPRPHTLRVYTAPLTVAAPLRPSSAPLLVTKDFQRTTLKAHHKPVLRALAEAMFSPDGEVAGDRLDGFVEEVDRFISPASKTLRFGLVVMLFVIRWSPLFFFKLKTFDELPLEERIEHLKRLEHSKSKQLPLLVVAYKTVLSMLFYEDEKELEGLGYRTERKRWLKGRSLPVLDANKQEESAA
jgi:hypothetical protein